MEEFLIKILREVYVGIPETSPKGIPKIPLNIFLKNIWKKAEVKLLWWKSNHARVWSKQKKFQEERNEVVYEKKNFNLSTNFWNNFWIEFRMILWSFFFFRNLWGNSRRNLERNSLSILWKNSQIHFCSYERWNLWTDFFSGESLKDLTNESLE